MDRCRAEAAQDPELAVRAQDGREGHEPERGEGEDERDRRVDVDVSVAAKVRGWFIEAGVQRPQHEQ